jgi:hypothetical protein
MKCIGIISILLAFSVIAFSQDDLKLLKDGVVMRDGKLYKIDKEGSLALFTTEYDFGNGVRLNKGGELTFSTGLKTKLREGEVLLKNGTLGIFQNRIKQLSGYIFKEGKMLEILPTDLRSFEADKIVLDSNKLTSTGKYFIGKSGKFIQLFEDEVVTLNGEVLFKTDETSTQESFVIKRDAVVIKAVNNKMAIVDGEYLFPNGMKVTAQGVVSTKEGLSFSLKSGEKLNSKGELFLNGENLYSNGLTKKDGLVYLVKDGKVSPVNEDYVADSMRVSSKGIITYGNKPEKFVMKEGDLVSLEGKLMVSSAGCAENTKGKKDRFVLDHILFKEGKLFIIKDAESSLLTKDIVLSDGSKIFKIGHIIKPNGSKILLHEGQRIALNGEELPDEKPEETSNPDKNYLTMLRGRVWIVTDGKPALLKEDYNINGKMIVHTDGFVQKSDGGKMTLKENDRLSLDGVVIAVEKRPIAGQLPSEYYIMKAGKMWSVIDSRPSKLEKDIVTNDGARILMDGTILKKNKQRFTLKDNEKVDSKGELITIR